MNQRDQYFFDVQQKINAYAQAMKDGRLKEAALLHQEVGKLTSPLCAALLRDSFESPSLWCSGCNRRVPVSVACAFCAYNSVSH